ncbi:ABC transporter ATP-binding protein [Candidatus Nomurabacteria bacterium]|nr:ABC transporter ATP-binding protein [Candidatus Nomurabacteria bacterium]
MLELKLLSKKFGSNFAVQNINLLIKDGEFFSLLGPSGCGKTTLLRMLGGFEKPTCGEIWQEGVRIDQLPPNERHFNIVFQRYALFPHLNVWENVAFGLKMKKVPKAETKSRVKETLDLVKMEEYADRSIETLSGGQQQRVALARALVNRPKVLLLDEPLSALDLKLRQQMQVELLALQRRLKHTFIFVTHDQEEALTLSDRIAVMNQGVVEQVGTPQEIYEYPKTLFVSKFIGSINSFSGEVKECTQDALTVNGFFKRPIQVKPTRDGLRPLHQFHHGAQVHILVRPEKLKLLKSQPGPEQNSLEGSIKEVLYQGAITHFFVKLKDTNFPPVVASQPNSALTAKKGFSTGDRIYLAWSPEDCLALEKETNNATKS